TGKELSSFKDDDAVNSAAFSPDGKSIVTTNLKGSSKVWSIAAGKPLTRFEYPAPRITVISNYDGKASTSNISKKSFDAANRSHATIGGMSSAFSPDGKCVITTNGEGEAKVWNSATGMQLLPVKSETYYYPDTVNRKYIPLDIFSAAYSPDGSAIVTVGAGGVQLLNSSTGEALPFNPDSPR